MEYDEQVRRNKILALKFTGLFGTPNFETMGQVKNKYNVVLFSRSDHELNLANEQLARSLEAQNKPVMRAIETHNPECRWIFIANPDYSDN